MKRLPVNWLLFYADSGIKSKVCEGVEKEEKDGVYDSRFTVNMGFRWKYLLLFPKLFPSYRDGRILRNYSFLLQTALLLFLFLSYRVNYELHKNCLP